jgi:hypothetical protein
MQARAMGPKLPRPVPRVRNRREIRSVAEVTMWLFTRYGMYSVVLSKDNPEIFMVRARVKDHLLALKKRFGLPKQPSVLTTKNADYR